MSKSSKTSLRSYRKYGTRKKRDEPKKLLKPYNFCCDVNDPDDETQYDKRKAPFASSLTVLSPIQESPLLKFRFQSIEPVANDKRKSIRHKSKPAKVWNLDGNPCVKTHGPLLWFQEDELEIAKCQFWSEKQKIYNEEADRNAVIGEKKTKKILALSINTAGPRWYQDLSIPQMKQVLALRETITADYEETITTRTQKALSVIGVTSTFFQISPDFIKKLQRSTRLEPIQFLREIYRKFSGHDFQEEEYKKTYDCNEKIILSAIAFLALPDTVIELNNRLPIISKPSFPLKPKPMYAPSINHGSCKSPYMEPLFEPADWLMYKKKLEKWRTNCKLIPRPKVILPKLEETKNDHRRAYKESGAAHLGAKGIVALHSKTQSSNYSTNEERSETEDTIGNSENHFDFSIPTLPGGDKQTYDFTISGLGERSGPVNYKICGTLNPPFPKRKSWLGEKEAHYIISGISEHEDPPKCPVTYVMTGISYVTPNNSDDKFFAELKLGDSPRRIYPAGRKNLSKNWQEWLQDADEEFLEVEQEANKLIKSVEATMRLVIPGGRCDPCCSCRQTRKTNLKEHATKTPYMVIESIAEGDNQNRYIVGSLAMHSPAPSPEESTVNLLEVVASKETVQKKLVINGITNDSGETTYYISGVTNDVQYAPKTSIFRQRPPKPLRNVPPCACNIEQIFNEGNPQSVSGDDIPQIKKKSICYGHKYRPNEAPAYSCREYPEDKSCRRNPFDNKLKKGILPMTNRLSNGDEPKEKKMFTLPAFVPCGDEDGMAVCGGPWGAKNSMDQKIIEEANELQISKVRKTADEEDEENEEEEEEEEEEPKKLSPRELAQIAKESEARAREMKRKQLKRDKLCSQRFEDEVTDPNKSSTMKRSAVFCEFDNQWNRTRTAPTINPWENEYEKSLKLTDAILPSSDHKKAKSVVKRGRQRKGSNKENIENNNQQNDNTLKDNVQVIYSGKQETKDQPRLFNSKDARSQKRDSASKGLVKNHVKQSSPANKRKPKRSVEGTESTENKIKSYATNKKFDTKVEHKMLTNNYCTNNRNEKSSRTVHSGVKKVQRHRQNDGTHKKIKEKVSPKRIDEVQEYKVAPAVIPEDSRLPCQTEKSQLNKGFGTCECSDEEGIDNDAANTKEGPFGWRTKSQQELPREKTLVYLSKPNYPVEMVKLREGGRPCICRENRNKKKILLYNLGGAVADIGKGKKRSRLPQLIEGVTYVTPAQSPRNSSEYIPEYDLLESPYKMCERKRSEKNFRSHSPDYNTNTESCPCGHRSDENKNQNFSPEGTEESKNTEDTKRNRLSLALDDEGLIDYFVSCQDEIPCWLKCAKFAKAGCCEKPRLLQVKKPVCECRYERRVVRREEEKRKWVDRQQRLKATKKQPYLQVSGTSRPMAPDTKLMISSVKKVLRDGEFLPETQYCVTGIAENYAMGLPQQIIPGITMQSPVVTPEPSKPDILCMCGHRHWSPTDITTELRDKSQDASVRGKAEYPCRGRTQESKIIDNMIRSNEITIPTNNSQAYHSCAHVGGTCHSGFTEDGRLSTDLKKRKTIKNSGNLNDATKYNSKRMKFNAVKLSQGTQDKHHNAGDKVDIGKRNTKLTKTIVTKIDESMSSTKRHQQILSLQNEVSKNKDSDSVPNASNVKNNSDLFGLMKIELKKMANEDFILAKLPECWLMPQLQSWIEYREGKVYTDSMKKALCHYTTKHWGMMQDIRKPSIPLPSLNLTRAEVASLTYDRASEMKAKISIAQAKYFSELRKMRVSESSLYWPTMDFGRFPNLSFKEAYFTYMAGKEADGHVFRPWKIGDSKQ